MNSYSHAVMKWRMAARITVVIAVSLWFVYRWPKVIGFWPCLANSCVLYFAALIGRWDLCCYWAREVLLVVNFLACYFYGGIYVTLIFIFLILITRLLMVRYQRLRVLKLSFPFEPGIYYCVHGGSSRLVNYHGIVASQKYALDLVRLGKFGFSAKGFFPSDVKKYYIYGTEILSPCSGTVIACNNIAADVDKNAEEIDRVYGNFIRILLDNPPCHVVLAHLMQGSVAVRVGDHVNVGDYLGKIGNSGNSREPHLHIHAQTIPSEDESPGPSVGLPIEFDGRFLIRNNLMAKRGLFWRGSDSICRC